MALGTRLICTCNSSSPCLPVSSSGVVHKSRCQFEIETMEHLFPIALNQYPVIEGRFGYHSGDHTYIPSGKQHLLWQSESSWQHGKSNRNYFEDITIEQRQQIAFQRQWRSLTIPASHFCLQHIQSTALNSK